MQAIEEKKGVLVIDSELPIGIIANTAAIQGTKSLIKELSTDYNDYTAKAKNLASDEFE